MRDDPKLRPEKSNPAQPPVPAAYAPDAPLIKVEKFAQAGGKLYGARLNGRLLRRGLFTHTKAAVYGGAVWARLQRWKQVAPSILALPLGYRDKITNACEIHFSFWDRVRLLLGYRVALQLDTLCEFKPGRVSTVTDLRLGPPAWWVRLRDRGPRPLLGTATSEGNAANGRLHA